MKFFTAPPARKIFCPKKKTIVATNMNAGLGNLATLKQFLLAASLRSGTTYDANITLIGKGVAALMDRFCNRGFAYASEAIIFTGNRPHYYLPRFPFNESAALTVEMRYFLADAWADISGQPLQINSQTGLVHFGYTLGRDPLQVRVTYSGGYFFETKEPTDNGYPTTITAGATALPDDVQLAWLTQCMEVWNKIDKLGTGIIEKPNTAVLTDALQLSPMVKEILQGYVRYQLT